MNKIKKTILNTVDMIAVCGFAITALLEIRYKNIPVWVCLGFAVVGLIVSVYEMLTKEQDSDELSREF